jgi:hypothetical protein
MTPEVGKLKLRRGRAIVVPADTVIILPEDSRLQSVMLHFIRQAEGTIKHIAAPIDDRSRRPR